MSRCFSVGMSDAAVGKTASGVVAVLATSGTLSSDKFAKLLDRFGGGDILFSCQS